MFKVPEGRCREEQTIDIQGLLLRAVGRLCGVGGSLCVNEPSRRSQRTYYNTHRRATISSVALLDATPVALRCLQSMFITGRIRNFHSEWRTGSVGRMPSKRSDGREPANRFRRLSNKKRRGIICANVRSPCEASVETSKTKTLEQLLTTDERKTEINKRCGIDGNTRFKIRLRFERNERRTNA